MTTEYEPGRIYSGVVNGKRITMLRQDLDSIEDDYPWVTQDNAYGDEVVTDVRGPLVVLDPDDFPFGDSVATVKSLRASGSKTTKWIADQIEAQTYMRPDEPTNLGAVVIDANGAAWVRWHSGVLYGDWLRLQDGKYRAAGAIWEGIDRPRVVHQGWDGRHE